MRLMSWCRCCLAECNVKHTFFILTVSGASGWVAFRSKNAINSDIPPPGLAAALLCLNPLTVIWSNAASVDRELPLPRTFLELDFGPFGVVSLEPMPRRTAFCIADGSIPVRVCRDVLAPSDSGFPLLGVRADPRMAAPRPRPLVRPFVPAWSITRSPSLSTRAGVVLRFWMPPLLGRRLAMRPEARGPVGGGGWCSMLSVRCRRYGFDKRNKWNQRMSVLGRFRMVKGQVGIQRTKTVS